ncbi:MAG: hypothetical protein IPK87_09655 [Planctomycetes bacterium]|nr:hypothetical protein [Planctomycetota bacterium]
MTKLEQLAHETPPILMRDPLAEFLGLRGKEIPISYSLEDAGRFAGHLCPTVATAFEMTREALRALYGAELPVRGNIRVTMASAPDQFANGPMARVIGFVTGAARDDGFRGLAGRWSRQNLLLFAPDQRPFGSVLFERLDNGASVRLVALAEKAGTAGEDVGPLLRSALENTHEPLPRFQQAWMDRVQSVLTAGPRMFQRVD